MSASDTVPKYVVIETEHLEEALSLERPYEFRLYRVFDLSVRPRIFSLTPPLRACVNLETASWRASFR